VTPTRFGRIPLTWIVGKLVHYFGAVRFPIDNNLLHYN
jgi:hypothetical protein